MLSCVVSTSYAIAIVSTGAQRESDGVRFFFTVTEWEGPHRICHELTFVECGVQIVGAQYEGSGSWQDIVLGTHRWPGLKPNVSMTEIRKQMKGFGIPFKGSLFVPDEKKMSKTFCITFAETKFVPDPAISFVVPVGPCTRVSPVPLVCKTWGSPVINHGNLNETTVEGNQADITLQITCSGPGSVIATIGKGSSRVALNEEGTLYSIITLNNQDAAAGVPIQVAGEVGRSLYLASTLFTTKGAVKPGAFSGSTVLTISPP